MALKARSSRNVAAKQINSTLNASRVPRYVQMASVLRRRVDSGVWPVGTRLPSIEELEAEFGVARVTVREALAVLREEGIVEPKQGRGTFVLKGIPRNRWLHLDANWKTLLAPIARNVPHELRNDPWPAPVVTPEDGRSADDYVCLRSVQTRQGKPYAIARVLVARHLHARSPAKFRRRIALAVIAEMKDVAIKEVSQTLVVDSADVDTAGHLGLALNAPVAEARIVVRDSSGVVVYLGEVIYRGDCVCISISLTNGRSCTSAGPEAI